MTRWVPTCLGPVGKEYRILASHAQLWHSCPSPPHTFWAVMPLPQVAHLGYNDPRSASSLPVPPIPIPATLHRLCLPLRLDAAFISLTWYYFTLAEERKECVSTQTRERDSLACFDLLWLEELELSARLPGRPTWACLMCPRTPLHPQPAE